MKRLELIDWSERYPKESALEIAIRQSTYCPCGKAKEIGEITCGHQSRNLGQAPEVISTRLA